MAQEDFNPHDRRPISPALELAILNLWARAMEVERSFSRQDIEAIPELSRAIEAAKALPAAIGWDNVLSAYVLEAS